MSSMYTEIAGIEVPLIITRRAKTHSEVLADFEVSTTSEVDPICFIPHFSPLAKRTILLSNLVEIAQQIKDKHALDSVDLRVAFSLLIDRVSPTFVATSIEAPCHYRVALGPGALILEMGIRVPAQLRDVYPLVGTLDLTIRNPRSRLVFEDLWDCVQKAGGFSIFPLMSAEDKKELAAMQDKTKSVEEILTDVSAAARSARLGVGGYLSLHFSDVYTMYEFKRSVRW